MAHHTVYRSRRALPESRRNKCFSTLFFWAKLFKRTLFFRPILCSAHTEDINNDWKESFFVMSVLKKSKTHTHKVPLENSKP